MELLQSYTPGWLLPYLPFLLAFGLLVTVHLVLATFFVSAVDALMESITNRVPLGTITQYTLVDYFLVGGSAHIVGVRPAPTVFWIVFSYLVCHFVVKVFEDDANSAGRTFKQRKMWLSLGFAHGAVFVAAWMLHVSGSWNIVATWLLSALAQMMRLQTLPYAVGLFLSTLGIVMIAQLYIRGVFAASGAFKVFLRNDRHDLDLGLR